MYRKIILGTVAAAGLTLIAACNDNTTYTTARDDGTVTTVEGRPAPGTNNETVSAIQDAASGAVGSVTSQLPGTPDGFVDTVAHGDMYEVRASQIALTRGSSPDVKRFAQQMIDAHTETSNQLKAIAMKAGSDITIPTTLPTRHQSMLDNLTGASAADLDGRYIAQQLDAHNEALNVMQGYAKDGDHVELKQFAAATAPKVQMHLEMVQELDRAHRARDAQARDGAPKGTTQTR